MHLKNKRGQSTVEYVLLVTAVLAVIIAFTNGQNSAFKSTLNSTLGDVTDQIGTLGGRLDNSHASAPAQTGTTGQVPPYTVNVDAGV